MSLLVYIVLFCSCNLLYSQNTNKIDDIINKANQYYRQAQNDTVLVRSIDLSAMAIGVIMDYLPNSKVLIDQVKYAEAVTPMLKFNANKCIMLLALANYMQEPLDDKTAEHIKWLVMQDCNLLLASLELNSTMNFLWGSLNYDEVYFMRGMAKYYLNMPYHDDLEKAGEKGKQFLLTNNKTDPSNNITTDYSTYYNPRYGFYITYPSYLYIQGESENLDGKSFFSKDAKIKLTVSAIPNFSNTTTEHLMITEKQNLLDDKCSVTYSFAKNNKIVLSGHLPNGNIYYQKTVICSLYSQTYDEDIDVIATARVEYPTTEKKKGTEIIELFNKFPSR